MPDFPPYDTDLSRLIDQITEELETDEWRRAWPTATFDDILKAWEAFLTKQGKAKKGEAA